jgi:minichromosome maintenance protein 10
MAISAVHKRKSTYDPRRQWGLKPDHPSDVAGTTYHFSGHVAGTGVWTSEQIGREGQAKAQRRQATRDSDRALKALLENDKDGMKMVMLSRVSSASSLKGKNKEKEKAAEESSASGRAYSSKIIRDLGFDPGAKRGNQQQRAEGTTRKVRLSITDKEALTV